MGSQVKIGVLGCASIAKRYMLPALSDLKNHFNVIGIASRNFNKANELAGQFDTVPFDGYDAILENTDLDAVYIPLPNALHATWIEKALVKGINVLVEKPSVINYDDALNLNRLAEHTGLVLMENFQFRFHKQLECIKTMIADNYIGELRGLRSSFGFPPLPNTDIRYKNALGGGALFDAGVYPIKVSQIFLGLDVEVMAASLSFSSRLNVDEWGGVFLRQRNGNLFAELAFGMDNFYQCNLELWGSKGKITAERIFTSPPNHEPLIHIETAKHSKSLKLPGDNHFRNMLLYFYDLVIKKERDKIKNELIQNLNQARLTHEVFKKAHEK